jgi:hypothetical protein
MATEIHGKILIALLVRPMSSVSTSAPPTQAAHKSGLLHTFRVRRR